MAVPKKRTSKAKSKARKAKWKATAKKAASQALALGKSIIIRNSTSFVYLEKEKFSKT